jgi:hypothetical protein
VAKPKEFKVVRCTRFNAKLLTSHSWYEVHTKKRKWLFFETWVAACEYSHEFRMKVKRNVEFNSLQEAENYIKGISDGFKPSSTVYETVSIKG